MQKKSMKLENGSHYYSIQYDGIYTKNMLLEAERS